MRRSTARGWGWNHNKRPVDLSRDVTICPACGRINPHIPPAPGAVRDERGFVDPLAINRWTLPTVCAGCAHPLRATS